MSFKNFLFHPAITAGITACGYAAPTPIQKNAIPPILGGRDILGLAQTGTGKTAAFALPLLQRLLTGPRKKVRALIVAPTRELAEQINDNIGMLGRETGLSSVVLYGGVGKTPQMKALKAGVEIVVACPGRLLDLLQDKALTLKDVEVLVLDEADHMFDKGFLPDLRRIIKLLPVKRQTLLFSATMPDEIGHLAAEILVTPETVKIDHKLPAPTISHVLFQIAAAEKTALLKHLVQDPGITSALVFTRTKHKAKSLALHLEKAGFRAASLQGNLSQQKRQQALDGFRDGTFRILVATDIAARGIDVMGISHVINYDVPDTAETYTHRTGRTGRATRSGQAFTFADRDDGKMIALIERNLGRKMVRKDPPACAPATESERGEAARESSPRHRPAAKKTGSPVGNRKGRDRACSFDFGLRKSGRR